MKKNLIAYASITGSTKEISEAIGKIFIKTGLEVDIFNVKNIENINNYRAIIIGTATRLGKILPETIKFAEKFKEQLRQLRIAYFISGITMREDTEKNRTLAKNSLKPLCSIQQPVDIGLFAGKVDYSKLGFFWKMMGKLDKSGNMREGDWRNWEEISTWAEQLIGKLVEQDI